MSIICNGLHVWLCLYSETPVCMGADQAVRPYSPSTQLAKQTICCFGLLSSIRMIRILVLDQVISGYTPVVPLEPLDKSTH